MRKYLFLIKNQIGLITTYRVELFGRWIMSFFEIIVYYSLWRLTSSNNPQQTQKIFIYFVLTYGILQHLQTTKVARWMAEDILSGDSAAILIKPIIYPLTVIIRSISAILSRIITPAALIAFGIILLPDYFAPYNFFSLVGAIITALLGLIFWNQLMVTIGIVSFWGTEIESLAVSTSLTTNLIKGAYIPAFLFPQIIKDILQYTPFNYLVAVPIDIYLNPINLYSFLQKIIIILIWLTAIQLFVNLFYKKAIKHYQIFGG